MQPPSAEEAALERQLWAALARNQQLEALLADLTRSRGVRALQGWWRLQERGRNLLRLARGTGKPQAERARLLLGLLRELGPRELARALWEVVEAPPPGVPAEADAPPPEPVLDGPLVSVLVPVKDPDPRWLAAALASLERQSYQRFELCLADDGCEDPRVLHLLDDAARSPRARRVRAEGRGISAALNAALAAATGEWVALLDHDDELAPHALAWIAHEARDPEVDVIYSDEDKLDPAGRRVEPFFKPDWSPHYLLSLHYLGHLTAYRRALVEALGGFRGEVDGAQDHDLALRAAPRARRIVHVPRLLYHWRQSAASTALDPEQKPWAREAGRRALADALPAWGIEGEVEPVAGCPGGYRVRPRPRAERVAVIVPTRDRLDLLRPCLESVLARSTYPRLEVLVVDNGSRRADTLEYLAGLEAAGRARVLRVDLPFNFALLVNRAAAATDAEVLCLLNDDTEVQTPDWAEAMLEALALPGVGAVGPLLTYPDGSIQHAGVLLGVRGVAGHAFLRRPRGVRAPGRRAHLLSNYSAVTGACLMVRRADFLAVGGLDEEGLPNDYGDVDLCLRLGRRGLRSVYTPFATLVHREGASRGRARDAAAEALLRRRYPAEIASDPCGSPHFISPAYPGG